ncbi:MAG: HAD-IB family phosphatase [Chlamydiae bacterium]|nr:HAD-IB family phosphatase [Chlamydiota bacterium]
MKKLHVFDLDRTLLIGNCSFAFFKFLAKMGFFSFRQLLSALINKMRLKFFINTPKELHEKLFKTLFRGRFVEEITNKVPLFLEEFLKNSLRISLFKNLQQALERKETVLLLSNSPSFLVSAIAKQLGIIYWSATEYAEDCKKCFDTILCMMDGETKALFLTSFAKEKGFLREEIFAYSDSIDDLPLLEQAGHKIAVAPDKRLRCLARNRGWSILET